MQKCKFSWHYRIKLAQQARLSFPNDFFQEGLEKHMPVYLILQQDKYELPFLYCIPKENFIKKLQLENRKQAEFFPIMREKKIDAQGRLQLDNKILDYLNYEKHPSNKDIMILGRENFIAIYSLKNGETAINKIQKILKL